MNRFFAPAPSIIFPADESESNSVSRSPRAHWVVGLTAAAIIAVSGCSRDASCYDVTAGLDRSDNVPRHGIGTLSIPNIQPQELETAYVNGTNYFRDARGRWQRKSLEADQESARHNAELRAKYDRSCRLIGNESMAGQAAVHYEMRTRDPSSTEANLEAVSNYWFTQETGLLMRQRIELSTGTVVDSRNEYSNVRAPIVEP